MGNKNSPLPITGKYTEKIEHFKIYRLLYVPQGIIFKITALFCRVKCTGRELYSTM
jgi:hypothetical protein